MLLKFNNFITENIDSKGTLLYYAFDWDDNILTMPTQILVLDDNGQEVGMTTEEFRKYRMLIGKEDIDFNGKNIVGLDYNTAFRNFRDIEDPEIFKKDVTKAINMGSFGPAWDDFIECLTNGSVFAIITARGHEAEGMRKGVEYVIDNLNQQDKEKMHDSLLMFLQLFGKLRDVEDNYESLSNFSKSELVQDYLDLCHFVGVSAPSRGVSAGSPEEAKVEALREFITDVNGYAQKIGFVAKVGFSDDDKGNIEHMTKALSSEDLDHEQLWPFINEFIIKDTNVPGDILKTNIPTRKIKSFESFSQTSGLESSIQSALPDNNLFIASGKTDGPLSTDNTRQDVYGNLLKNRAKRLAKESGKEYCECCDNLATDCECVDTCDCSCKK